MLIFAALFTLHCDIDVYLHIPICIQKLKVKNPFSENRNSPHEHMEAFAVVSQMKSQINLFSVFHLFSSHKKFPISCLFAERRAMTTI